MGGANELGSDDCVAIATAKVEILRGPFAVSPQVNGACSCSEGGRQPVRKSDIKCVRKEGKVTFATAKTAGLYMLTHTET